MPATRTFHTIAIMAIAVAAGCSAGKPGGLAFPGMAQQRVSPPGTGAYAAPDRYYRGPESVALPNQFSPNPPSLTAAAPIGSGIATASYSEPNPPSSNPPSNGLRTQYRGMPVIDLTSPGATQTPSPPPMIRGQNDVPSPNQTDASSEGKETPESTSNLLWQTPAGI